MPYFDYNATAPLVPEAREEWLRVSEEAWMNPSSPYRGAARGRIRLDGYRERVAEFLGAKPEEIVFAAGATEAAHAVMAHLARSLAADTMLAVNPTEHPAVLGAVLRFFADRVVWLPLTAAGGIEMKAVQQLAEGKSVGALVMMAANNESGVIYPWAEAAGWARRRGVPLVCDATQWLGKLPGSGLGGPEWVFGSAHKFGGPKGVGLLKIPAQATDFSMYPGGGQERGHRGGTENLAGIGALVAALARAERSEVLLERERLRWREQFERAVEAALPGTRVVAAGVERLWNTVSLILPYGENVRWVLKLDQRGFQVSTGSACATGKEGPSHVLKVLGYSAEEAKRVIRVSSGAATTEAEWGALLEALKEVSRELVPAANVVRLG